MERGKSVDFGDLFLTWRVVFGTIPDILGGEFPLPSALTIDHSHLPAISMKRLVLPLMIAAVAAGFTLNSAQAEEGEIIYRATGKNIYRAAESAAQKGRSTTYRAPIRAQYDGFVYRDEGLATRREEHRSYVVSLYCDSQNWKTVQFGHALAK